MKNRVINNWKSTTLGVLLLIIGIGLVYLGKATLTEVSVLAPISIGLIISKDKLLKSNNDETNA